MQQKFNSADELQINNIISLNARKSLQYKFFPRNASRTCECRTYTLLPNNRFLLCTVQTHPKCRNMITRAGTDVGKLSCKYSYRLVVNTTLLSHYNRGYKPLKAVNTCPYTAGIRKLRCTLSGRHIFVSRDVPQSPVS
jgi:hypothetical protein